MKKVLLAVAAVTLAIPTMPAVAKDHGRHHYSNTYDSYGRYREPRRLHRGDRMWQGKDGRYYCRRDNGTTGLIIGAAGGALVGRAVDTHGERTTGTILGAVVGGLLGREVDRGNARCR
ncbi:MAG: glycine zipper 2TM domain-containing protein [Novosphingobium sp.]|nr:glycine zipper 2TM domain-containing protein [Novosphingobium sp.]